MAINRPCFLLLFANKYLWGVCNLTAERRPQVTKPETGKGHMKRILYMIILTERYSVSSSLVHPSHNQELPAVNGI